MLLIPVSASERIVAATWRFCGDWRNCRSLGLPILIGTSRKSFIGKVLGRTFDDPNVPSGQLRRWPSPYPTALPSCGCTMSAQCAMSPTWRMLLCSREMVLNSRFKGEVMASLFDSVTLSELCDKLLSGRSSVWLYADLQKRGRTSYSGDHCHPDREFTSSAASGSPQPPHFFSLLLSSAPVILAIIFQSDIKRALFSSLETP